MALPKIRKDFSCIVRDEPGQKAILFRDFDKKEYWIPRSLISLVKKRKDENGRSYVSAVIAAFKFEEITNIKVEEMDKVFIPSGGKAKPEFCAAPVPLVLSAAVPFYYPGQLAAVHMGNELKYHALFCEPRTGKTLVSLTIAQSRLIANVVDHVIIVCPASLQENWKRDILLYYPEADTRKYTVLSVHSMSFESSLERIVQKFKAIPGRKQLIFDESHLIKNHSAKRTRNVARYFENDYAMSLTGTEVEKSLADTYHQYGVMNPAIIGAENYNQFAKNFMLFGGRDGEQIVAYQNTRQFGEMVSPLTSFLRLRDLDPQIPEPIELTEYYDMSANQREAYNRIEQLIETFSDKNGWLPDAKRYQLDSLLSKISVGYIPSEDELKNIFSNLGKLGEAADNLSRIKTILYDEQNERLNVLKHVLEKHNHQPAVIWCVFKDEVAAVQKLLPNSALIVGGMGAKKITQVETDFKAGKFDYVICNEAMSLGFQLARANLIVFFNNSMSRTQRFQSIRRSMLLGKHDQVTVVDIVARNGFDVRVREILTHKNNISKVFRNDTAPKSPEGDFE